MPESKYWAVFCLFMLVLTTGNAISERGFSAMSNVHTKSRSQLSVKQCRANMIISFNGAERGKLREGKNVVGLCRQLKCPLDY